MKANVPRSGMGGNQANMMKQIQKMQEEMEQKVMDPEEVEMLEDLLLAALNEANRKAAEAMEKAMDGATGGMNIPGLNGLF